MYVINIISIVVFSSATQGGARVVYMPSGFFSAIFLGEGGGMEGQSLWAQTMIN